MLFAPKETEKKANQGKTLVEYALVLLVALAFAAVIVPPLIALFRAIADKLSALTF